MVKFDFLSDTANSILEVCERARIKKEAYIKSLNRKISKKRRQATYWSIYSRRICFVFTKSRRVST